MNIYERAVRNKTRFSSNKGNLSVEDLFDLNLNSLNTMAKAVSKALKEESEEDFITVKSEKNTELTLQLDILKDVIGSKLTAQEAAKKAAETKAKKERLEALIIEKKEKQLGDKSVEELEELLKTL